MLAKQCHLAQQCKPVNVSCQPASSACRFAAYAAELNRLSRGADVLAEVDSGRFALNGAGAAEYFRALPGVLYAPDGSNNTVITGYGYPGCQGCVLVTSRLLLSTHQRCAHDREASPAVSQHRTDELLARLRKVSAGVGLSEDLPIHIKLKVRHLHSSW